MNIKQYAEALLQLPDDYLQQGFDQHVELCYQDCLYVAKGNELRQFSNGEWQTVSFQATAP